MGIKYGTPGGAQARIDNTTVPVIDLTSSTAARQVYLSTSADKGIIEDGGSSSVRIYDDQVLTYDGTAAKPGFCFRFDSNTGLYLYASDELGFTTGGTHRGRWTSAGLFVDAKLEAATIKQTYLEAGVTTAVDVKDVNFRIYSGGTQTARIDYTTGYYYVNSTKVLGARATGWTSTPTGTLTRTTFVTGSVTLPELAERVAALINDLHAVGTGTHGIIGS